MSAAEGADDVGGAAAPVDDRVGTVLVVNKTHLDVGFTATAAQVRARYLEEYFPRAMSVAEQLRSRGGPERFRWTTGSWILTEALDAAAPSQRAVLERAIEHGDLVWHGLPFTLHTEYCDRSLLEHGMTLSAELDRRFGRHTRAAKVTDVPGHTRGLVSVLADAGVDFLHVGVNPASSSPDVPQRFRWVDQAAVNSAGVDGAPPVIQVMYQPGGYGDVQILDAPGPNGPVAIVVDLTGDNLGPLGADDVVARWAELARRFPRAQLAAATLNDVAAVMAASADSLPVLDGEIGDTWIQGVGSDPVKTAGFRELCRLRRGWIDSGMVTADDPVLRAASTSLLCVAEHTWGLDQKTHWPDTTHWSADELASLAGDPAAGAFEASWDEQRRYLDRFVELLADGGRQDLADQAGGALEATRRVSSVLPGATTAKPVAPTRDEPQGWVGHLRGPGGFEVRFDADGSVVGLRDDDGRELASVHAPLGRLAFQTFDAEDFERWYSTYNGATLPEDEWWARWDNTKPGLEHSDAMSRWWSPTLTDLVEHDGELTAVLRVDAPDNAPVALPVRAELTLRRTDDEPSSIEFDLRWFDRPAARWPGAVWWTFAPAVGDAQGWRMSKLDEWVSPFDVVPGGGVHLHCADRVRHTDARVELEFVDTSLVAPGAPRLLEWPPDPVDLADGWSVCLHDNVWGTNFPMWDVGTGDGGTGDSGTGDKGHARFRARLRWERPEAWRTH